MLGGKHGGGMNHYMVDCFAAAGDILPSERFHIKELSDDGAIQEAKGHCSYRKLAWFRVRAPRGSGDDRVIYDSRNET
jgi:hypothetical protein